MSVKVKLRGNGKAMIRFSHPVDEQYFIHIIRAHRDDGTPHPKIILKDKNGTNIPKLPPPKPMQPIIQKGKPEPEGKK